jgi:transcriptional regulator with XRE-family HTH domain
MPKSSKTPALISIGKQIRALRKARHFSQESFANEANINRGYYGTIERGEANLTALNLIKIARALNTDVGALFPASVYHRKGPR